MSNDARKAEFLRVLRDILHDPKKIDIAVMIRASSKPVMTLTMLDAHGIFKADGSMNQIKAKQSGINLDEERLKASARKYNLSHLSMRELLIIESALFRTADILGGKDAIQLDELQRAYEKKIKKSEQDEKGRLERELLEKQVWFLENRAINLVEPIFKQFFPIHSFKFTDPMSLSLTRKAEAMLSSGCYQFKETNVSISPGPQETETAPGHAGYDVSRDIYKFLDDLIHRQVKHVFAMGLTYPYHPQNGISQERELVNDSVIEKDFINYFIPELNGKVKLPDLPELQGIQISAKPIRKVGRFISYEIKINDNEPIQVHHFPMRDKQPLDLTDEELAYVKSINAETPKDKRIHTHCRSGRGRSGQLAFLLAAESDKYKTLNVKEQLRIMRKEKFDDEKSKGFIETTIQEDYLEETKSHMPSVNALEKSDEYTETNDEYFVLSELINAYIEKQVNYLGFPNVKSVENLNKYQKELLKLMEYYKEFLSAGVDKLSELKRDLSVLLIVSSALEKVLKSDKVLYEALFYTLEQDETDKLSVLLDKLVLHKPSEEIYRKIHEFFEEKKGVLEENPTHDTAEKIKELFFKREQLLDELIRARIRGSVSLEGTKLKKLEKEVTERFREAVSDFLDQIMKLSDPEERLTEAQFESIKSRYKILSDEVNAFSSLNEKPVRQLMGGLQDLEPILGLPYDALTDEPTYLSERVKELEAQLSKLIADNLLDQDSWNTIKSRFMGYKMLFDGTAKVKEVIQVTQFDKLTQLFKSSRECVYRAQDIILSSISKSAPLDDIPIQTYLANLTKEVLAHLACLSFDEEKIRTLDTAFEKLLAQYNTPPLESEIDREEEKEEERPTPEDYQKARAALEECIRENLVADLQHTDSILVRAHTLLKDIQRYIKEEHDDASILPYLSDALKLLQQEDSQKDKTFIKKLFVSIDDALNTLKKEIEKKQSLYLTEDKLEKPVQVITEKVERMNEEIFHMKAEQDALLASEEKALEDEIHLWDKLAERKVDKVLENPKPPKLIVFDVDDTLVDLEKGELKRKDELIEVLKYAKKHDIDIAIATNRTPSLDQTQDITVDALKIMIRELTGIDISQMLTFKHMPSISQQMHLLIKKIDAEKIVLTRERETLEKQLSEVEEQTSLKEKISDIKAKENDLDEKLYRLASGKNIMLDAIKMHYNEQHQLSDDGIQAKVREAFLGSTLLAVIDPEHENKAKYESLIKIATTIANLPTTVSPKPSFLTILKDFIFDANQPEKLNEKYKEQAVFGKLDIIKEAQELKEAQEFFKIHLSDIESYYNTALENLATIDPEHENSAKYESLIEIATTIADLSTLRSPKPSFLTILKDLIFDANQPKKLKKKYGELAVFGKLDTIKGAQAFFKRHLSDIESYYNTALAKAKVALAKAKAKVLRQASIKEQDIVFLDDSKHIISSTRQSTNYRAVKVSDPGDPSFRYMVDFNYELGAYNGLIDYLAEPSSDDAIRKKQKIRPNYLNTIPNFKKHGFMHTPIVRHIPLSTFLEKLFTLDDNEKRQNKYRQQFIEAGIERFDELSPEIQRDFIKTLYKYMQKEIDKVNESLKGLKEDETVSDSKDQLKLLKCQIDKILGLDKLFAEKIGPTFLKVEAKRYRLLITYAISGNTLEHLNIEDNKVIFAQKNQAIEDSIAQDYISIEAKDLSKMHPVLKEVISETPQKKDKIIDYYNKKVQDTLNIALSKHNETREQFTEISPTPLPVNNPMSEILQQITKDFDIIKTKITTDPPAPIELFDVLSSLEKLIEMLPSVCAYQAQIDIFSEGSADVTPQLPALLDECRQLKSQMEATPQYIAKLFCEKAEAYLKSPDRQWNVGMQWTKHVIEGTNQKIPKTVARQLQVLKQAHADHDYVKAKQAFLKIGIEKQRSRFSSKASNQYFSLFKPRSETEPELDSQKIENEFDSPSVGKHPR